MVALSTTVRGSTPFSEKYRGCVRAAYRHVQYRQDADEEADLGAEIIAAFAGAEEVRDR